MSLCFLVIILTPLAPSYGEDVVGRACVCGGSGDEGRRPIEKGNRATHMSRDENLHRSQQTKESQLADLFH